MPITRLLCKIADKATENEISTLQNRCLVHKTKCWKIIDAFTLVEVETILWFLGAVESQNGETLYAAYIEANIQNRFSTQAKLFSLIFENYSLEEDFCVRVNIETCNQRKQIKNQITNIFYDALYMWHQKQQQQQGGEIVEDQPLNLPACFLPTLCRYQERTVKWLLQRELQPKILCNYTKSLQAKDGLTTVYKNLLYTEFYDEVPQIRYLPPGGILADEMGLGKTVELLALMLLHKRQSQDCQHILPNLVESDEDDILPLKRPRIADNLLCLCGASVKKEALIKCSKCNLSQHVRCVSKHDDKHSNDINEPYFCPACWKILSETKRIPSVATLIVTPATIRVQWLNEIKRHISENLRIFNYEGALSKEWISPRQLADYDIVLTDYSILKREVYYTDAQDTGRTLRRKTRLRTYTPLLMIEWWRCCLDEAQMTESEVSKMAALVHSMPAINRWAISGTPIQRSIDDVYPLVRFIGLEDYVNASAWSSLVREFMQKCDNKAAGNDLTTLNLIQILGNFMWRTGKQQVEDELPIPPQTIKVHNIVLSDLERLYYTEQHKECKEKFEEALGKYLETSQLIVSTSQRFMNIIMRPLLRIRMCCTIPTIIAPKHQHALTGVIQKQFLQPKELHAHLLRKNEMDCKSELRSMASSHNGIAALYFIEEKYEEAVNSYEKVLKLANEYKDQKNISVDSLLQIHALHNILQARNISPAFESKRSKDTFEAYETELNSLEWKYLETYASQLCRVYQNYDKAQKTLQTNKEFLELDILEFISTLLQRLDNDENTQTQLLSKILHECIRKFGSQRLEEVSSLRGVLYVIATWFKKLEKIQSKIIAAFDELQFFTTNIKPRCEVNVQTWRDVSSFINSVCDCHLIELRELEKDRNSDDVDENQQETTHNINRTLRKRVGKNLCKLCKLINLINNYECLLFKKSMDLETNALEGDENPQLEFEMIKIIFSYLKPKQQSMSGDIEKHFATMLSMQNFCKMSIKYWIEIEFTVKAYDELDMCKMRTTLTDDADERSNFKILRHEIDLNFVRQKQNLSYAQHCFDLKYARLKYIKRLEADSAVGRCPICQSDEEVRHAFLVCGHQVCWACYKFVTRISHGSRIRCSLCRNEQPTESVYFMTSSNKVGSLNQNETINGDYSAKLTYIVQLLKQLIRDHNKNNADSTATLDALSNVQDESENDCYTLKVLIFSQWSFVLSALADALSKNGITYSQSGTVRSIENFRKSDSGITCLLMPLSKGCKGLNLIEATHVFLIEPVLNPSEELQAIGRVHRFGQTRPTTVHRFIVEETVEENIYDLVSKDWQFENLTFENLRDLFTQVRNG